MADKDSDDIVTTDAVDDHTRTDDNPPEAEPRPKEVGGRGGLDPTRYGDWEKGGRCIDF